MLRELLGADESIVGRYGLEFEVEGDNLPNIRNPLLKTEPDGSLRGGVEYIFRSPQDKQRALEIVEAINNRMVDATPSFSFRTSTHVHINVLDLPFEKLKTFLYTLYLVEPCLLQFSGPSRKGNRFCLGLLDAEFQVLKLAELFNQRTEEEFFRLGRTTVSPDEYKYSAINLAPMFSQGSVEVRTLYGTLNPTVIDHWLTAFDSIFSFIEEFDKWTEVESYVINEGFSNLIAKLFSHNEEAFCGITTYNELSEQIKTLIWLR